jgi:hypothetical protein
MILFPPIEEKAAKGGESQRITWELDDPANVDEDIPGLD